MRGNKNKKLPADFFIAIGQKRQSTKRLTLGHHSHARFEQASDSCHNRDAALLRKRLIHAFQTAAISHFRSVMVGQEGVTASAVRRGDQELGREEFTAKAHRITESLGAEDVHKASPAVSFQIRRRGQKSWTIDHSIRRAGERY
jgi:hypothetical protein